MTRDYHWTTTAMTITVTVIASPACLTDKKPYLHQLLGKLSGTCTIASLGCGPDGPTQRAKAPVRYGELRRREARIRTMPTFCCLVMSLCCIVHMASVSLLKSMRSLPE